MNRRAALLTLGAAAGALGGAARAQAPAVAPSTAPAVAPSAAPAGAATVFLDYTQDALDRAYDQRVWAPNAGEIIARYASDGAAVRARTPPRTERYGEGPSEALDIFGAREGGSRPVMVFLHGGAWRALTKEDASGPAPAFVEAGAIYVALDFAVIPTVRLPEMAAQCRRALSWIRSNIARFGGDPDRIHVSGHSSGAHLAAVLLTTDWAREGLPDPRLKGGAVLSGMYELHPVLLSARSSYVKVSAEEIAALSPMRHLGRVPAPVLVAVGERESPEFLRHAAEFGGALAGMGRLAGRHVLAGRNHFEVPLELNAREAPLTRAVLATMGLS